jgi:dihydrodipicolinate synthase/N-acetylneuraminate lyase
VAVERGSDAGLGASEEVTPWPVLPTTVKAGLNLLGTHVGDPRPPLLPLDEAGLDEMRALLID